MEYNNLSIALINVVSNKKDLLISKDLNGGLGINVDIGKSWSSRLIKFFRGRTICIPVVSFAYLQAILLERGAKMVNFFEGNIPSNNNHAFDLILIYGSLIDYHNENQVCYELKKEYPNAITGFFGSFPSVRPDLFRSGDFVIVGQVETFFMDEFSSLENMEGIIAVKNVLDINKLPSPNLEKFPIHKYSYAPALSFKPFFTLQGSLGCPYSCGYYCTYGALQGKKIFQRSPKNIVDDIIKLKQSYGIKSIQFRDPVFGLNKGFIDHFCYELKKRKVEIKWGMETRSDLLNDQNLSKMFDVGLRLINIGIETVDPTIAKHNKRKLVNNDHQEKVINFCNQKGIKVSAFFILGLENDNEDTIMETIDYAIKLNIFLARFSISTPYPGTQFFDELKTAGRLLTEEFEDYTQFKLVFDHPHLTPDQANRLLEYAYRRYYFRPKYFLNLIKWKFRGLWL
jgi:anaerobic magnesium-protoporphyrin IX monomethyl ester cyclase